MGEDSYPRQSARTQRFTLGAPRNFTVSPDGSRVAFLRSRSGTDRTTMLWVADVGAHGLAERIVADPRDLFSGAEELSAAERARRERTREGAGGVVGYATDGAVSLAAFALSGGLYVADLVGGGVRGLDVAEPVIDPRPDPTGRQIAYVAGGAVRVIGVDGTGDRQVPGQDPGGDVSWGLAEFIAAEEMGRYRGYWWSPDGDALLVARVDNAPVRRWHIADPAQPGNPPAEIPYPAAGTPNARVTLHLLGLDGSAVEVRWDADRFEYLNAVHWSGNGNPLLLVQTRDQRTTQILEVEPNTGATVALHTETDPVWIDLVDGVPAWCRAICRCAPTSGASTATPCSSRPPTSRPRLTCTSPGRADPSGSRGSPGSTPPRPAGRWWCSRRVPWSGRAGGRSCCAWARSSARSRPVRRRRRSPRPPCC
jgi:dipeptidyl-peptidase-4